MLSTAFVDGIRTTAAKAAAATSKTSNCVAKDPDGQFTSQNMPAFVVVGLVLASLLLDVEGLIIGIVGALGIALFQIQHGQGKRMLQPKVDKIAPPIAPPVANMPAPPVVNKPAAPVVSKPAQLVDSSRFAPHVWRKGIADTYRTMDRPVPSTQGRAEQQSVQTSEPHDVNKAIGTPIPAPTFSSSHWDGEVAELVRQIKPTAENDETVNQLASIVKHLISPLMPTAEVAGYASVNINSGKAFYVAVSEVEIVATVKPADLIARMIYGQGLSEKERKDDRKVQKWALRQCERLITASGSFKFRRSAMKGDDPKVTLLADPSLGLFDASFAMDFSVNVLTPFYNAALLAECGQMEPRAKELILLVKRWAKNRHICHANKGHLSPYLWGLLGIYFLQVEGEFLPSLRHFKLSSSLLGSGKLEERRVPQTWHRPARDDANLSTAVLFQEFIKFYTSKFDWRNEAVSVRLGRRFAPDLHLSERAVKGPRIEDPFKAKRNLGDYMTAEGMTRLKEELRRADAFCHRGEPLAKLLEPWLPTEKENEVGNA